MTVKCLAILLSALSLTAQEFRATLQGTVQDPSKAVIAGAELTLRNTDTAVERKTSADAEGHYLFQFVAPGNYSLTTRASGFKTDIRDAIKLSLSENVRLDVDLAVGQTTETITVTGAVSTVQTESSSLGSVVRKEIIDSL